MRDLGAEVQASFSLSHAAREVQQLNVALLDAERAAEAAEKHVEKRRAVARERRIALGRYLAEIRPQWTGKKSRVDGKTWTEFLGDQGIDQQRAHEWMTESGYSPPPRKSGEESKPPTQAETGARGPKAKAEAEERKADTQTTTAVVPVAATAPATQEDDETAPDAELQEIGRVAEDVDRKAQALQLAAQRLLSLLRRHDASVGGPRAALVRASIIRANAAIGECYQLTSGDAQ